MVLAFKAALVVIAVMVVVGFLGYLIERNIDRQTFN
jgi:hypothetical protein